MATLHTVLQVELHVVAQIVETELVVCTVGHVGGISFAALLIVKLVNNHAHAESEEAIQFAHPLRVALGQIIIHRDHMHAATAQRIQINGKRGNQRFSFAGFHFGDFALVQNHAADQLNVKVAHVENTPPSFTNDSEGFHQDLVEYFIDDFPSLVVQFLEALGIGIRLVGDLVQTLFNSLSKFIGIGAQLFIAERFHGRLQRADGLDIGPQTLEFALVFGPKHLRDGVVNQNPFLMRAHNPVCLEPSILDAEEGCKSR